LIDFGEARKGVHDSLFNISDVKASAGEETGQGRLLLLKYEDGKRSKGKEKEKEKRK